VVAAEAALELLEHRAATADAAWPEFSEYDCFACHHSLSEPSWRQQAEHRPGAPRGAPAWGSWYFPLVRALTDDREVVASTGTALDQLIRRMEKAAPSRLGVREDAHRARAELGSLHKALTPWKETKDYTLARMKTLVLDKRLGQAASWDAAEQTFLAFSALNRIADHSGYRKALEELMHVRAFQPGYDSPLSLPAGGFDPRAVLQRLSAAGP
jgi:hypothetical protein